MKSIKLTSNAFKGKDYIVSVPVVVKPAVTRNLAYNLKEAMNTDPALGLVLSEEKFSNLMGSDVASQILNDLLNHEDTNHNSAPLISIEKIFDPAEYLKDTTKYQKQDLENPEALPEGLFMQVDDELTVHDLEDPADLLAIRPDIDDDKAPVARLQVAYHVDIAGYGNGKDTLVVPVECELVNKIPAGVSLSVETDNGAISSVYSINIDGETAQEGAVFYIKVTLDMSNAVLSGSGNHISNPKIAGWKASRVFKGSVSLLPLD